MTLTIDFKDNEGYVHAILKGTFDPSEILTVFEKTFIYVSTKKATKVLFDCRDIEGEVPWAQITGITKKMSSIHTEYAGFTINEVVIAALTNEKDLNLLSDSIYKESEHDFFITSDYEQAEKWLISKKVEILQMA